MNNCNILVGFLLFTLSTFAIADTPTGELNYPEFSPITALGNESEEKPEFRNILNSIKKLNPTLSKCPANIISELNRLSKNRGLLDSTYFYRGICSDLEGDHKTAIDEYEKSLKLKRSNKGAILRLAYLSAINKNYKETLTLTEELTWLWPNKEAPETPIYLNALAQKELGNLKEATLKLDQLDSINPKFTPALLLRKNLILKEINDSTDPKKVKILRDTYSRLLPRLISQDPENREYALEYAKILLHDGHPLHSPNILNQGIALTKKFTRSGDKIDEAFQLLEIQFLEKQGKTADALKILDTLAEKTPIGPNLEFIRQDLYNKLQPKSDEDS